ncbi:class I SAM-dependent methyltransferase [Nanoarchaeota archaeon]
MSKLGLDNEKTIEVYDEIADDYADYMYDKIMQYPLMKFTKFLPKTKRSELKLLDVGCASGRDSQYLMEDGYDVIGIDLSKNMIKSAKKLVPKCKFENMDLAEMKYKDKTFNGIWDHATFCHVPKKHSILVLEEYNRVMKSGAILYIGLREGEGEKMVIYEKSGNKPRFFSYYNMEELAKLLKKAGFEILENFTEEEVNFRWVNVFAKKK